MNGPSVVLLGNHSSGNPGYPNIERNSADRYCQVFADRHRYGSGWGVCIAPPYHADYFDTLMNASGSVPFIFSYVADHDEVPELPFVFAPSLFEAMAKLEARLAEGKFHDPNHFLPLVEQAADDEDCGKGKWPDLYRKAYAEHMRNYEGYDEEAAQ